MRRRDFTIGLGAMAVLRPFGAAAQPAVRMRRVGVLAGLGQQEAAPLLDAFRKKLHELGWEDGRNIRIDPRFTSADFAALSASAGDLVKDDNDVIFVQGTPGLKAVRQHSPKLPVVFILVADPVGQGLVKSLSRPGGAATGFTNFEFSIAGKWLELLREIAPSVQRVAVLANPANPNSEPFSRFIEKVGKAADLEVTTAHIRAPADIGAALDAAATRPGAGLMVLPDSLAIVHREQIIRTAADRRLPAVYPFRVFPKDGGLISYGLDFPELYRQAAVYVDRILRGVPPSELPVQAPSKLELVVNLKAAASLGLSVPSILLARADEVIE